MFSFVFLLISMVESRVLFSVFSLRACVCVCVLLFNCTTSDCISYVGGNMHGPGNYTNASVEKLIEFRIL